MRLENRSRRQKKKGPRQSTEWTQAEGEQEGGEGGLVNTAALPPASTRGKYFLQVRAYISLFHATRMILQYLSTLFTAIHLNALLSLRGARVQCCWWQWCGVPSGHIHVPAQLHSSTTTFSR